MNLLKRAAAGIAAVCIGTVFAGQTLDFSGIDDVSAAYNDVASEMEWGTVKIGGGGFVSGIVTGKDVMYARTDVGGAYKYNYDTESWEQLLDFINDSDRGLLSVDAMAIDPTDDNTVYFLCGCMYFSDSRTAVFKTTDGGKTFEEIDVSEHIKVHGNGYGRQCGESIAVDPDNPDIIYAGGDVVTGDSGLIKSTDGGKTWNPVEGYANLEFGSGTEKRHYFEYKVHWPWYDSSKFAMAATTKVDGEKESVTQNGVSFITITNGKVYVGTSVTGITNVVVADVDKDEFTELSSELPTSVYPSRVNFDADGNLLICYVAGLQFERGNGGIYRYNLKDGTIDDISPAQNSFGACVSAPDDSDKLYATTTGAFARTFYNDEQAADGEWLYRSTDGGKTWQEVYGGKHDSIWIWDEEIKDMRDSLLFSFMQSGKYDWIYNKAIHWTGAIVINPKDSTQILATSGNGVFNWNNIWGEGYDDSPVAVFHPDGIEEVVALDFVSTPDGKDLSAIGDYDGFVHESVYEVPKQHQPNMGSTSAIAVCPQNTDVQIRIAENDGSKVTGYYTLDGGNTWTAMKNSNGGKAAITELGNGKYRFFKSERENSAAVSYSDDFGETWTACEGIPSSYGSKPTYMFVEPEHPEIVYAYVTYYNSSWGYSKPAPTAEDAQYKLCVSTDGGRTFTSTDICMYDQCDSAGRIAYLEEGHLILGGGWYGLYDVRVDGTKVTSTKIDSVSYCKTVGYGAPEKAGGINTLYIYGKPEESDPEGIYRSNDGGKTWDCINLDHLYGGTGNGNFLVGDMNEYGKVYMSTVGCGIVYGQIAGSSDHQPSTEPKTEPSDEILWGDANVDKKVSLADAVAILQSLANKDKYPLTEQGKKNADVYNNGDGVTANDALTIQQVDAKIINQTELPVTGK